MSTHHRNAHRFSSLPCRAKPAAGEGWGGGSVRKTPAVRPPPPVGEGSKHPASATNTIYIHLSALPVCKPNHTPTNMTATSHTHGEERRYHYGNHRQNTRRSAPSPAGRSPQRGRVGEGVSDIAQEPKWRFFTFAAPTPALPHGGRGHIGGFLFFSSLHKFTSNRFISNLFHYTYT